MQNCITKWRPKVICHLVWVSLFNYVSQILFISTHVAHPSQAWNHKASTPGRNLTTISTFDSRRSTFRHFRDQANWFFCWLRILKKAALLKQFTVTFQWTSKRREALVFDCLWFLRRHKHFDQFCKSNYIY